MTLPPAPLRDLQHPAVDVGRDAGDHPLRRLAEPRRPGLADQVVVAADAAGGDQHRLRGVLEVLDLDPRRRLAALDGRGLQHLAAYAGHGAVVGHQAVDAVPEAELDAPGGHVLAHPPLEGRDDAGTGAPGEVEARHRVAVTVGAAVAALGPAHDREEPVAHLPQPGPLLPRGEVHVRLGPLPRPVVLGAVELRRAEPVLQRQVQGVLDAHPALLGAVDEEQAAERPERLPAQRLLGLLVEQQHPPAGVRQLGSGGQPGEAGSHDDGVGVHVTPLFRHGASTHLVAGAAPIVSQTPARRRRGPPYRWQNRCR